MARLGELAAQYGFDPKLAEAVRPDRAAWQRAHAGKRP